jgi:hypothetical protein
MVGADQQRAEGVVAIGHGRPPDPVAEA